MELYAALPIQRIGRIVLSGELEHISAHPQLCARSVWLSPLLQSSREICQYSLLLVVLPSEMTGRLRLKFTAKWRHLGLGSNRLGTVLLNGDSS